LNGLHEPELGPLRVRRNEPASPEIAITELPDVARPVVKNISVYRHTQLSV
jgi:hypothetical protein